MSLDSKWLVCSLTRNKKKWLRWGLVWISSSFPLKIHVIGCRHHRTNPRNLGKGNKEGKYYFVVRAGRRRTVRRSNVSAGQASPHKAALQAGGLEGCRVIKVKALADESAKCFSCGSDSLWGHRSAGEPHEHAREYVPHPRLLQVAKIRMALSMWAYTSLFFCKYSSFIVVASLVIGIFIYFFRIFTHTGLGKTRIFH